MPKIFYSCFLLLIFLNSVTGESNGNSSSHYLDTEMVDESHTEKSSTFTSSGAIAIVLQTKSRENLPSINWPVKFGALSFGQFPQWRKLILSEFLKFEEEEMEDIKKFGEQKCACGEHLLREMQKIEYGDWHFRVWPKPLGSGTTSNVFHAHAMEELDGLNNRPIKLKNCVAIKSVLLSKAAKSLENEMRNELAILREFAGIEASRVIRLFAFKENAWKKQLLFVLELGEMDLSTALENLRWKWHNDSLYKGNMANVEDSIKRILLEILEAVREMHKLVMHLDLKPANMLYVKESDGKGGQKMVLKVIDFGGSELIPLATQNNVEFSKRANVCKIRANRWATERYMSPEQYYKCEDANANKYYKFTTKSDIWTVGAMLLEMLLNTPIFHGTSEEIRHRFSAIIEYYYRSDDFAFYIEPVYREDILKVRNQFPQLFDVVKSTFNINPAERPTARGLIAFLSGGCQLKAPREMDALVQDQLFPGLSSRGIRVLLKLVNKLETDQNAMARLENVLDGKSASNVYNLRSRTRAKRGIMQGKAQNAMICDMDTTGSLLANSSEASKELGVKWGKAGAKSYPKLTIAAQAKIRELITEN